MSFDRFLLVVESRDLSQADKICIRVSSFPKLSDDQQNSKLHQKNTWHTDKRTDVGWDIFMI